MGNYTVIDEQAAQRGGASDKARVAFGSRRGMRIVVRVLSKRVAGGSSWLTTILLAVTVLVPAQRAAAQACRADFDASGAVEINELIAAVNEALTGCDGATATPSVVPSPTPTVQPADPCPWQFDQLVTPNDDFCRYVGTGDSDCTEPYRAETAWTTRGDEVFAIIISAQGVLAVVADRTAATSAAVKSVAFGPDFQDVYTTTGTLTLASSRAMQFSIQGLISECGTLVLDADFIGLANAPTATTASVAFDPFGLGAPPPDQSTAGADEGQRARLRALLTAIR